MPIIAIAVRQREIKMKPVLLFVAALALSSTLTVVTVVSAQQCDIDALLNCTSNLADMVSKLKDA